MSELDLNDRKLLTEIRLLCRYNPFRNHVFPDELSCTDEFHERLKRLEDLELIKRVPNDSDSGRGTDAIDQSAAAIKVSWRVSGLVKLSEYGQTVYVSDFLRFIMATLIVFVAAGAVFPILGALSTSGYRAQVLAVMREEFVYLELVVLVAAITGAVSQGILWYLRERTKKIAYQLPGNSKNVTWRWFLASIIESIPFYLFFFVLHGFQGLWQISNGGLPRSVAWVAIILCPIAGGIGSYLRFQPRPVFAAVLPLRVLVISVCLVMVTVVSWLSAGGTFFEDINVRMLLTSVSMLAGITLIVAFLWCAEVKWIERVSPWHP
ncbi:MAG: hypothetical protein JSU63_05750 [Phycisphaerales bacterium]|nr:MAG: hypothetical protein JSU63_05750 [Phycisphaerales bacterium]